MANYGVTNYMSEDKQYQKVVADLKTQIETIVNTKTIRVYTVVYRAAEDTFVGILTYDT